MNGKVTGVIYAFPDPTHFMREFELSFDNASGLLVGVFGYPTTTTSLQEARKLWGTKYKEIKYPNSNKGLLYIDRRLTLLIDKRDTVISIGVY